MNPDPSPRDYDAIMAGPGIRFGIRSSESHVTLIEFLPPETRLKSPQVPLAQRAAAQLAAYLENPRRTFDLPLLIAGTPFRQRVWQVIAAIPCGRVRTYKAIADDLKSAPRAVGGACGANPVPIVVPCHRVVSTAGIGGFDSHTSGFLLDFKRWLLRHEGVPDYC